jgi:hypothetical protein
MLQHLAVDSSDCLHDPSSRQSLLSTARCCNVCGRNLITGLTSAASPKVDISSTCMVGQKFGVSLPLLTCSPSVWPSRLLYLRGRNFRRGLWVTLYYECYCNEKCTLIFKYGRCFNGMYFSLIFNGSKRIYRVIINTV